MAESSISFFLFGLAENGTKLRRRRKKRKKGRKTRRNSTMAVVSD